MKTQMQIYREVERDIAAGNSLFMDLIKDKKNPLTNADLKELIKRNPGRWSKYKGFIGKLKD